jgi:hypothetical protein
LAQQRAGEGSRLWAVQVCQTAVMCSQGAFGGALRCPEYAKDLPRKELIEVLKTQFIRRGFSVDIPADCYDESRWNRDEVAVFFQSGGSVKPRCTLLVEAGMEQPGGPAAAQAAPPPSLSLLQHPAAAIVASADEAVRAADLSIPTVRLSLEGRMVRAELLKAQEDRAARDAGSGAAAVTAAAAAASVSKDGGGAAGQPARAASPAKASGNAGEEVDDDELLGWAGF